MSTLSDCRRRGWRAATKHTRRRSVCSRRPVKSADLILCLYYHSIANFLQEAQLARRLEAYQTPFLFVEVDDNEAGAWDIIFANDCVADLAGAA